MTIEGKSQGLDKSDTIVALFLLHMTKGEETKLAILKEAKALFLKKGFNEVTMTDICQGSGLSRGGLYRHFPSTREIFICLLKREAAAWEEDLAEVLNKGLSSVLILRTYFQRREEEINSLQGKLSLCSYEYLNAADDPDDYAIRRFEVGVSMLQRIFDYGIRRHELPETCDRALAELIITSLDGIAIAAVKVLNPESISRQIGILRCITIGEDNESICN